MVIRCLRYAKTKIIRVVIRYIRRSPSDPDYTARFKAAENFQEFADDEKPLRDRANCRIKTRQSFFQSRTTNYSRQDVNMKGRTNAAGNQCHIQRK